MSSDVRKRRRSLEERVGAVLRHSRPGDLSGRSEPLPRDGGGRGRVSGGPGGGADPGTQIEHVTAYAAAGQTVAAGGATIQWDREAGPPTERRGFETFSAQLAADGSVGAIPVDLRGFALVDLRLPFTTDVTATCTIQRIRGGTTLTIVEATGTGPAVTGGKGFWVAPGDQVKVTITSDVDVTLSSTGDDPQIELEVWSLAAITSTLAVGDYEATVLADTPLGYWKLDESAGTTAADSSGNSNDGTYSGTYTLGTTGVMKDGQGATAVTFSNGSASMGDLAGFEFTGTAAFTAEAWVRLSSIPSSSSVFYQIVEKLPTGGGSAGWELYFTGDGASGAAAVFARTDGSTYTSALSGGLTSGIDYHVVGTYDGTTLRLYVNGTEVATAASSLSLAANGAALEIGKQSIEDAMAGVIDEVAVYDRALSAAEVSEHYSVGTRAA